MMDIVKPSTEDDVLAAVIAARDEEAPVEIVGHGSKRGFGHQVEAASQLDTSGLTGISFYEPAELVVTVRPGTPMSELEQVLADKNQELAFEPMNPAKLWRSNSGGTIGGAVAVNAGGPRRIKAGAARDHLLGFRAVSGRGEIFKSGGQVMKNVTGYDLSKLVAGSFGTLAVLTELSLKVLPRAETERSFVLRGLSEDAAVAVLAEASGMPYEISSFACLPDGAWLGLNGGCSAILRLEGPQVSVDKRFEDLVSFFGPRGQVDDVGKTASRLLWASLRDVEPMAEFDGPVWKISTAPTAGAPLVAALRAAGVALQRWYYDWAGGLVWLLLDPAGNDEAASTIRSTLARFGGHATLVRATEAERGLAAVFQPQPDALAALSRRVKASFDPLNILNRGRLGLES